MATADRKPVVYLIAQPTVSRNKHPLDITNLYEHGDLQVLLPQGDSPTFTPFKCIDVMTARFEKYDPEIDFLVWAGGDTLAAVFAGMLLSERDIYRFRWLRYERARTADGGRTDVGAKYIAVDIDIRDEQISFEDIVHDGNAEDRQEVAP